MLGVDETTFQPLRGWDHTVQSVRTIIRTAIGSRVSPGDVEAATGEVLSVREFGSELPRLIDAPQNDETLLSIMVAVVEALRRWEPRVSVERVVPVPSASGRFEIHLSLIDLESGEARSVEIAP